MERAWLARRLKEGGSYEAIAREAGCSASKVAYWAQRHGLRSAHVARHAARGPLDEALLRELVAEGLTVRALAAELGRSPTTIRHWLTRLGLQTHAGRRLTERDAAPVEGRDAPLLMCAKHGRVRHVARVGRYRCCRCRSDHVVARRRRVKRILVAEAGGACLICGYDRSLRALEFHHVDPRTKRFGLANRGLSRAIALVRAEAAKCVLLCSNCHAEVEDGLVDVPVRSTQS